MLMEKCDGILNSERLHFGMGLRTIVTKGEKQYVALCPELDVVSQGKTFAEALSNLKEAIELHIEVLGYPREKTEKLSGETDD